MHIPKRELLRVLELLFDQYSVVARKGTTDTTEPVPFSADTIFGRYISGELSALTDEEVRDILDVSSRAPQSLATAATINYDLSDGVNAVVTLNQAGHTLAFSNPLDGMRGQIVVIQDGGGNRTITSYTVTGGSVRFASGSPPVLSTGLGDTDILEWYYDGTNIHLKTFIADSS